jgi:hypothetical protein
LTPIFFRNFTITILLSGDLGQIFFGKRFQRRGESGLLGSDVPPPESKTTNAKPPPPPKKKRVEPQAEEQQPATDEERAQISAKLKEFIETLRTSR